MYISAVNTKLGNTFLLPWRQWNTNMKKWQIPASDPAYKREGTEEHSTNASWELLISFHPKQTIIEAASTAQAQM